MVWDEINHLKRILKDPVIAQGEFKDDNKVFWEHKNKKSELTEFAPNALLRIVDIKLETNDGVTLKGDVFDIKMFKHSAGKGSDFIILCHQGSQKYAIFVDLKSSITEKSAEQCYINHLTSGDGEYVEQINGSLSLFDYLASVIDNFYSCGELKGGYQKRCIVLYRRSVPSDKLPYIKLTRPKPKGMNLRKKTVNVLQVPATNQIDIAELIAAC